MSVAERTTGPGTHTVSNQAPPIAPINLFTSNVPLVEALEREGAGWAHDWATEAGAAWGTEHAIELGVQANENKPVLKTHDRFGNRVDEVEFHPAYHELMRMSCESGGNMLPWTSDESGAHAARVALGLTAGGIEAGHGCPMTMTFAAVPALRHNAEIAAEWEPLLSAAAYDPELKPAQEKGSAKCGMAMT